MISENAENIILSKKNLYHNWIGVNNYLYNEGYEALMYTLVEKMFISSLINYFTGIKNDYVS